MTLARLDIGARQTEVRTSSEVVQLALGSALTAEAFFRHDPPTPTELESAIDGVEDEVMRVRQRLPGDAVLQAHGAALREVADAAGVSDALTLDAVEQLFQRLASASLGNPVARHGLPAGKRFVATLLILREFMHHLGFTAVRFGVASD